MELECVRNLVGSNYPARAPLVIHYELALLAQVALRLHGLCKNFVLDFVNMNIVKKIDVIIHKVCVKIYFFE